MPRFLFYNSRGFSIFEILVAISIIAVVFSSLLAFATFSLSASTSMRINTEAFDLTQEAMEAVRNFRDGIPWNQNDAANEYDGLGVLVAGVDYYPRKSAGSPAKWQIIQGRESIGIFTRRIVFSEVQRDGQDNIVESGGIIDLGTKKASVFVSWLEKSQTREIYLNTYLTDWKN